MKKYAVGDTFTITATVVEVHPQGYPGGLDKFGRPNDPTQEETADIVIAQLPPEFGFDSTGRAHFSADKVS